MSAKRKSTLWMRIIAVIAILASLAAAAYFIFRQEDSISPELPVSSTELSASDAASATDIPEVVEPEPPDAATLMFGGDILIHKTVYTQAKTGRNTYDFKPYLQLFNDVFVADYNSVNLETPIDIYGGNEAISTYPSFNAPLELLDAIKGMNIDLCTNSNNHMIDYGYNGLLATIEHLDASGLERLGTYASPEEHDQLFIREINGISFGFVAYTQTTNGIKLSSEKESYAFDRMGMDVGTVDDMLPRVNALREAGAEIIIAVLHWGTEYNNYPSTAQRRIAEALCLGGVDIIIGSHPHVVQPIEKMSVTSENGTERECLIVYSLGNLFCNQVLQSEYTQRGMVVALRFERGEDGVARLDDSFYMPTLLHVTWEEGADYIRLVPAGKYMSEDAELPELLDSDSFRNRCRITWDHVTGIVGNDIAAVTDPSCYPEGFFTAEEQ